MTSSIQKLCRSRPTKRTPAPIAVSVATVTHVDVSRREAPTSRRSRLSTAP